MVCRTMFSRAVSSWVLYHFHDTSRTSGVRLQGAVNDNEFLRYDGIQIWQFSCTDSTKTQHPVTRRLGMWCV